LRVDSNRREHNPMFSIVRKKMSRKTFGYAGERRPLLRRTQRTKFEGGTYKSLMSEANFGLWFVIVPAIACAISLLIRFIRTWFI
jgi:hypothetical protein